MGRALALLEAASLFAAASAMSFLGPHIIVSDWIGVAAVLGRSLIVAGCCVLSFYYNDLYNLRIARSFADFAARLLQSFGVAFILLAAFYTLFPDTRLAEGVLVSSLVTVALLLLPLRAISYVAMRSRPFLDRVLILGTGELARKLVDEIATQPYLRQSVVGIVPDGDADVDGWGCAVVGPLERLAKIVGETHANRVIVALAEHRGRLPVQQLLQCLGHGVVVEDGVEVYERLTGKIPIERLRPSAILFADGLRDCRRYVRLAGPVTRVAALIGAILSAPLFALIAVAIKLDSSGPVFFVQERIGLYGRPFRLFKFRTMVPDPRPASEWVGDNSDRVTSIGKWLRKFRLDELPQLINILRGEMSLVGPRPHPVSNFAMFAERIPHYALRCRVPPGVTGWAQVRFGYANNLEQEIEKMRFDLYYIKHVSLWLDLWILIDTVKIVLFGRWARGADAYQSDTLARAPGR